MDAVIGLVVFAILLGLYFLPTIIALARKKRNKVAIGALNFFLGWTLLGWIGALIWSLVSDSPTSTASQSSLEQAPTEQPADSGRAFPWKWIGIGVAGGAVGLIVLAAVIGGTTENTSTSSERPSTSGTTRPTPTPTPPPVVQAGFLLAEREANASRFDATYRGKWVTVYGRIDKIDNDKVYLEEQDIMSRVGLYDIPNEELLSLNVGEEYWATCRVRNYVLFEMELILCRTVAASVTPTATPVPPTATPVPPLTPEHMTTPSPEPMPSLTPTLAPTPTIATPLELVERVEASIVQVNTFMGSGTGFIFDVEGGTAFVATNHHVIERGLETVSVTVDNSRSYDALVLGWDPDRDVAVLSICCSIEFAPLTWGGETR